MKILDSTKTLTQLASDTTNGIGHISPLSCVVTEVLNGEYEAEITVSANDKYFGSLNAGSLLEIELDAIRGKQIFEIYFIGKPINEIASIKCQHITYRLGKTPVGAFSSTGAVSTVNNLLSHIIGTTEFTMTTDITNTTSNFSLDVPRYFREILGGYEGSLLDVFRGEYEWDNLEVKMLARRGSDNGVRIAYGKNLTDFNQEENNQEVYTSVLGYAVVDDITYTGNIYDKVVSTNKRVKIIDFSGDFESGDQPTVSELTDLAQAYADRNDIESPQVNITISFVPLYQTEEYKNIAPLERVNLGDTVHVFFDKLGVEASSRVVKTVWNVLTGKYDSVELGSVKANLNTVINESMQDVKEDIMNSVDLDTGFVEAELTELGDLVVNGLGLFITKNVLIDGSERIVLHNRPTLADSDVQYYISANGLVVSTDYGQTWNAGFTPDGDAVLNALSANIIRALQIYGSFLRFGDVDSNYIDVAPYSVNDVPQGVSFDGTGTIRLQPQNAFYVNNQTGGGNYYNRLMMSKQGSASNCYSELINYDDSHNYITANFIELDSHFLYNSVYYNRTLIRNNGTDTGTVYEGNHMLMEATPSANHLYLRNREVHTSNAANEIRMLSESTGNTLLFGNTKSGGNNWANYLSLTEASSNTSVSIYNQAIYANQVANRLWVYSSNSSGNNVVLMNYIYNSTDTANSIMMSAGTGGGRSIQINNYDPGSSSPTNQIELSYAFGIIIKATEDNIKIEATNSGSGSGRVDINATNGVYVNGTRIG